MCLLYFFFLPVIDLEWYTRNYLFTFNSNRFNEWSLIYTYQFVLSVYQSILSMTTDMSLFYFFHL